MNIKCPKCNSSVDAANIDIQKDSAVCPNCGEVFCPSLQVERGAANLNHAAQAVFERNAHSSALELQQQGSDWTLSLKRSNILIGVVIGFVLVFDILVSSFLLYNVALEDGGMGWQALLFVAPFLIGTLVVAYLMMYNFFGRVVLQKNARTLKYFVGVAGIGIYRNFDLDVYNSVKVVESGMKQNNQAYHCLELGSSGQAKVGSKQLLRTLPGGKAYGDFLYIGGFLIKHLGNKN